MEAQGRQGMVWRCAAGVDQIERTCRPGLRSQRQGSGKAEGGNHTGHDGHGLQTLQQGLWCCKACGHAQCIGHHESSPERGYPLGHMYAQHFGLKSEPFSIAPDPRYLFMSERHREALAHLLYGVGGGGGFVLLTGEIGAGKTTVCRAFLEQIPRRCNVAYIFNPKLTVMEMLGSVCEEFGIPGPLEGSSHDTVKGHIDVLNQFLLRTHAVGQNNVLIIDEAQNLAPEVLEQLRLLTNLETNERKLLQIILIGQPELREILLQPQLEQLAQRVIARFHLEALSPKETAQYIRHRLGVAGLPDSTLFEAAAAARVHQLTHGVPRRINLLCDRAMLGAYAMGQHAVNKGIVDKAATEVFGLERLPRHSSLPEWASSHGREGSATWPVWAWALLGTSVLMVAGSLILAGQRHPWGPLQEALGGLAPTGAASGPLAGARKTPAAVAGSSALKPSAQLSMPAASANAQAAPAPLTAKAGIVASGPAAASVSLTSLASAPQPAAVVADQLQWEAAAAQAPRVRASSALRDLASRWGVQTDEAEPCKALPAQSLQCFKSSNGLSLIRQLGRPVVLSLVNPQGQDVHALLVGLGPSWATIEMAGQTQTVSLIALSQAWHGDFVTWWRAPEGYRQKLVRGSKGPAVDWLAQRLAQLGQASMPTQDQRLDDNLQAVIAAFQVSQGIKPDGMAGAMTFMQINRLTGVDEPRLATEHPPRVLHP
jgi:general secretion pathway protein A